MLLAEAGEYSIWNLLVPFTILWWVYMAAFLVYVIYALENDRYFGIGLSVIITFAAMCFFGGGVVFDWGRAVIKNPLWILVGVAGWFAVGAIYSVLKWYLFTTERRHEYDDMKEEYLRDRNIEGHKIPDDLKVKWEESLKYSDKWSYSSGGKRIIRLAPRAWDNKSRISAWIALWPISAIWTMLDDIVMRIVRAIRVRLSRLMDLISMRAFKGTEGDFNEPESK